MEMHQHNTNESSQGMVPSFQFRADTERGLRPEEESESDSMKRRLKKGYERRSFHL